MSGLLLILSLMTVGIVLIWKASIFSRWFCALGKRNALSLTRGKTDYGFLYSEERGVFVFKAIGVVVVSFCLIMLGFYLHHRLN